MFVHGARDPFGSLDEMKKALELVRGRTRLIEVQGAGHDLGRDREKLAAKITEEFLASMADR